MTPKCCSEEFKLRHLGFKYDDAEQFYKLQWTEKRSLSLVYRIIMAVYSLTWLLFEFATMGIEGWMSYYHYFTNLQVIFINLYFLLSAVVVTQSLFKQRSSAGGEAPTGAARVEEVRYYHKLMVFLQTSSFGSSIVTVIIYWTLLASADPLIHTAINAHKHAVTLALVTLDALMIRFPVRLLHGVHTFTVGAIYVFYLWLLHLAGASSAVYPFMDWTQPRSAVGIGAGLTAFSGIVAQPINFAIFRFRVFIHSCCCSSGKDDSSEDHAGNLACYDTASEEQTV